jgi:hypothetical protein
MKIRGGRGGPDGRDKKQARRFCFWVSGLWQFVEEVIHGAKGLGFVGIEDGVIGVVQTNHLS